MRAILKIIRGILLAGMMLGIITCNNPMVSKGSIAKLEKTTTSMSIRLARLKMLAHQPPCILCWDD